MENGLFMIKVLLTGSTGLIGQEIYKALALIPDIKIFLYVRYYVPWHSKKLQFIDLADLYASKDRFDVLIHSASDIDMGFQNLNVPEFNILTSHHLFLWAKETEVNLVINLSSASLKNYTYRGDFPSTKELIIPPYFLSKIYQENLMVQFQFERWINFRISSPIGINMPKDRFFYQLVRKAYNNEQILLYGDINRIQNYVSVNRIGEAVSFCTKNVVQNGSYYLTEHNISNIDLANYVITTIDSESQLKIGDTYAENSLEISPNDNFFNEFKLPRSMDKDSIKDLILKLKDSLL